MGNFFRQNLVGLLIISAIGSVLGNIATDFLPAAGARGTAVANMLLKPIPAWTLFPYSLVVALAFGYWAMRSRQGERDALVAKEASARQAAESARADRERLTQQNHSLTAALDEAQRQLISPKSSPVTRSGLMGLVAVVLASSPPTALNPINHEHVCRHVAGLAGPGVPHAAIGDALASMLTIGAVVSDYRGLFLAEDWKERLKSAFPQERGTA